MHLTPLQARIAKDVLAYIRRERLQIGAHIPESILAQVLGVSRSPVRTVLLYLAEQGVVARDQNRGFFLSKNADDLADFVSDMSNAGEGHLYLTLAIMRLSGKLPELVYEIDLMRDLDAPRSAIKVVLSRMQQEGWAEHRTGQGWKMLPIIDSVEAYEESYALRSVIEPAGILSTTFQVNPAELRACRELQEYIAGDGHLAMTAQELFEANASFHETIASWSGNRFLHQTVRRLDLLRRLVEYRQAQSRGPRKIQAEEHLEILDCISRGDRLAAADKMRAHLEEARRNKVSANLFK